MLDVVIALLPAVAAAAWFFRINALILITTCVVTCLVSEWICNLIRKKPNSLGDYSAVVTGIILALTLPPTLPPWVAVIGSAFAIIICKMVFGGLGANVFNPAMASRAFLVASFGMLMTTWITPATVDPEMSIIAPQNTIAAVTQATPLAMSKNAIKQNQDAKFVDNLKKAMFLGNTGGCLGETSALAIIIGGIYLLLRKTITWHIPTAVLIAAFIFAAIAHMINPEAYISPFSHMIAGGLIFGAFFIATDPVTAPLSNKAIFVFGAGVGLLTMLIRIVGEYPEGLMYAILLMNAVAPLIDRFFKLTPFGGKPNE
jgi:electron transport complex protein RnfD